MASDLTLAELDGRIRQIVDPDPGEDLEAARDLVITNSIALARVAHVLLTSSTIEHGNVDPVVIRRQPLEELRTTLDQWRAAGEAYVLLARELGRQDLEREDQEAGHHA